MLSFSLPRLAKSLAFVPVARCPKSCSFLLIVSPSFFATSVRFFPMFFAPSMTLELPFPTSQAVFLIDLE